MTKIPKNQHCQKERLEMPMVPMVHEKNAKKKKNISYNKLPSM